MKLTNMQRDHFLAKLAQAADAKSRAAAALLGPRPEEPEYTVEAVYNAIRAGTAKMKPLDKIVARRYESFRQSFTIPALEAQQVLVDAFDKAVAKVRDRVTADAELLKTQIIFADDHVALLAMLKAFEDS